MSVLVTGGAGYIGSHMALELLGADEAVVVLDNLSTGLAWAVPTSATLVVGDVGDQPLVQRVVESHGVTSIIHFAGSIVVPDSVADPLGYYLNNTVKSRALIEVAVKSGIRHFIFSSTGGNAFDFPNSGTYKYTTRFVVSPLMYLLGGITVSGKFSADNSAILKVNGKPIAGISCVGSSLGTCFKQYTNFSIPSTYIQSGINEITVEVTNNDIYTGLIVESSVVSNCKKCEPPRKR